MTCLQCGQRTCFPRSSIPTPILRPQKGHGKVKVCDDIGCAVKDQESTVWLGRLPSWGTQTINRKVYLTLSLDCFHYQTGSV
jgi:hypothetical protein